MCTTDDAVLFWLHRHRQWPPAFPRQAGLLHLFDDPVTPREAWGASEWRSYAMFLEESGASLVHDLRRFERELSDARKKLTRRKVRPQATPRGTLLTSGGPGLLGYYYEQKKRGRKPSSKREVIASEILAIRAELRNQGKKRVTDKLALEEWLARNGKRRSRVNENRNLLNAVCEYRKKHNISKR